MEIKFASQYKTSGMDQVLGTSITDLTDRTRIQKKKAQFQEGARVYVSTNNGLIIPSNLPMSGSKGTVCSVKTANGDKTSLDGEVFVRWDGRNKIESVPSLFLKKASVRVSNLDDFYFLDGNTTMLQFASQNDANLVHKSTKDLWSVRVSEDGSFDVERLFDDEGNPLKI